MTLSPYAFDLLNMMALLGYTAGGVQLMLGAMLTVRGTFHRRGGLVFWRIGRFGGSFYRTARR